MNYNKACIINNTKYSIVHFCSKHKAKIFTILFLVFLAILVGIFTAIKISDVSKALDKIEFSFEALISGDIYTVSFFFKRLFSVLLIMGLMFVFSLNKFLCPLGFILLSYRAFLFALNCVLIVRHLGFGCVVNIIIIIPCQLLQLLFIAIMLLIFMAIFKEKRRFGTINKLFTRAAVWVITASVFVGLIELILLLIFKATTILII